MTTPPFLGRCPDSAPNGVGDSPCTSEYPQDPGLVVGTCLGSRGQRTILVTSGPQPPHSSRVKAWSQRSMPLTELGIAGDCGVTQQCCSGSPRRCGSRGWGVGAGLWGSGEQGMQWWWGSPVLLISPGQVWGLPVPEQPSLGAEVRVGRNVPCPRSDKDVCRDTGCL